ncbi:CDP-diacylglycerol--glycerol-3-phosphate 3-phosphatidyltransferase, partial [Snodgrassella alvi]
LLLTSPPLAEPNLLWILGNILMLIACILTIWSMLYYLKMATKEFKS